MKPAGTCGAPLPTHFLTASVATSPFGAAILIVAGMPVVVASPRRKRETWYRYGATGVTSVSRYGARLPVPIWVTSASYHDATSCGPEYVRGGVTAASV